MKKFFNIALVCFTLVAHMLPVFGAITDGTQARRVLKLRNKTALPRKVVMVTYEPSGKGSNGTNSRIVAPLSTITVTLEVGTTVYLANSKQVDYVMDGKSLQQRQDVPFCTVAPGNGPQVEVLP